MKLDENSKDIDFVNEINRKSPKNILHPADGMIEIQKVLNERFGEEKITRNTTRRELIEIVNSMPYIHE